MRDHQKDQSATKQSATVCKLDTRLLQVIGFIMCCLIGIDLSIESAVPQPGTKDYRHLVLLGSQTVLDKVSLGTVRTCSAGTMDQKTANMSMRIPR